ncbi:nitroreductase family deazaflavin-dependent oxidoreductase [Gordonia sp. CPCC 205515]|uniref:nitroreductase family deazaflavin-dependent oxidoreductase n=1 Tax=Gordonia sp. CPCC 205515 TaxID=3140791 RepID=UPI003AF400C8
MQLPAAVGRFNKVVTNPIQRLWAPRLAPWAMVEHVGRTSGATYSIPVLAWVEGDRLSIVLAYGRHTDWVRNVLAAGEFGFVRKSKHYKVIRPRIIPSDSPDVARGARLAAQLFDSVLVGTVIAD